MATSWPPAAQIGGWSCAIPRRSPLLSLPEWTGSVKDLAFDHSGSTLAFVGSDSDVAVWDLKRVHGGLATIGLAWDQPAPSVAPATSLATEGEPARPAVPVVRPDNVDSAASILDRAFPLDPFAQEISNR